MGARFKDYDSTQRATLCHLFADDGDGEWLGSVWKSDAEWIWEAEDADWDVEGAGHGSEPTRRKAKAALRRYLASTAKPKPPEPGVELDAVGEWQQVQDPD